VYGARVGDFVAGWVRRARHDEFSPEQVTSAQATANRFVEGKSGENPFTLREELGKLMWENVGIVRDGTRLTQALQRLAELRTRAENATTSGGRAFNLGWQQTLDVRNLLSAAELIARSALTRQDSRGAHFRTDFEQTDQVNWLRNIYLAREGSGVKTWTVPVKLDRLRP
jgi:succinate dehydrogenase/fumarate reductase flavoprotein subunit